MIFFLYDIQVAIQFSSKDLIVSPSIEMYDIDESGSLSYGILEEVELRPLNYKTVICIILIKLGNFHS